jgi:hypothetical protein
VSLVIQDHKVLKDHKAFKVKQDHRVHKDHKDLKVRKV